MIMSLTSKQKIIKFLTPILFPLVRLYWKIFRPETFGVKVIIENNGKFLLVRNSYGYKRWTFVGGGIDKGESSEEAGIREVGEEVGLVLKNLKQIDSIISNQEGKRDNIEIFYSQVNSFELVVDEFEIEEAGWFKKEDFPNLSLIANEIWSNFLNKNKQ